MQPQSDLVTLTIDGQQVSVPKGTLVLHAAATLGIEIPTFCYTPKLDPLGACRMCLVEIERQKGLPPACATPVAEGMVVRTASDVVIKQQKAMLEFLLINHPLDCPICDKGGECPLQNLTFKYGPGMSRFREQKRHYVKPIPVGPHILLDRERCILCQLCVRFSTEVTDDAQLVLINRGDRTEVGTYPGQPFDNPFSGNVIELCPVGALTSPEYRFQARPWDLQHTPSTCTSCGMGCNTTIDTRRNKLLRVMSRDNHAIDNGWLCDHGRFGSLTWDKPGRVEVPLVRRDGELVPVSWDEALDEVAQRLTTIRHRSGPDAVAGLTSATASNEAFYLLGKLMRAQLETDNVGVLNGSNAPSSHLGGAAIADVDQADVVLLFGADPLTRTPVLDLRLKDAFRKRAIRLAIVHTEPTGLDYLAAVQVRAIGGLPAMAKALLAAVAATTGQVSSNDPLPRLASPTDTIGISPAFGRGQSDDLSALARLLLTAKSPLVIYDEAVLDQSPDLLDDLWALSRVSGGSASNRPRLLALSAAANSRGAADMGAHASYLPGGFDLDNTDARRLLRTAWNRLPDSRGGLSVSETLAAAGEAVKAIYLVHGETLGVDAADLCDAVARLDCLVLQTPVQTPLMEYAHVVLPALGFGESTGSVTNTEGRIQAIGQALRGPEEAQDDWAILADVARRLGSSAYYASAADVAAEAAHVSNLPTLAAVGSLPAPSYVRPLRQLVINR